MYQHVYSLTIDDGVCMINIEVENSKHKFNKRKIVKCERLKFNKNNAKLSLSAFIRIKIIMQKQLNHYTK